MILCLNNKYDKNKKIKPEPNIEEKLLSIGFDNNDIEELNKFDHKEELTKFISRFSFKDCI